MRILDILTDVSDKDTGSGEPRPVNKTVPVSSDKSVHPKNKDSGSVSRPNKNNIPPRKEKTLLVPGVVQRQGGGEFGPIRKKPSLASIFGQFI